MKKLTLADIRPLRLYERARDAARQRVIELKRARRVALGEHVTLVFENRATMIFQVEEMVRAEELADPAKIQAEIEVYNSLLPDEGELSATLFVEIVSSEAIRPTLHRLVGIDEHVSLVVGGIAVRAQFEAGRSEGERISAVQYVKFPLPVEARRGLATAGTEVALVSDLPGYECKTVLSEGTRESLAEDLE
ncbi:MAG: DUF3501 family protein [Myxococcales bacterium]|nr:DUF3501 family protein [Myxococcales bacterium]